MTAQRLPFFANRECPYFPCHDDVPAEDFNCLFCFCPLYPLGEACGGNFRFVGEGVKDCSACSLPHGKNNGNNLVNAHFEELAELARRKG